MLLPVVHRCWLLLQAHQPVDCLLGGPDGVFHREDRVLGGSLDELSQEAEVGGSRGNYAGAVAGAAGKELRGYVGHEAGDGDGVGEGGL